MSNEDKLGNAFDDAVRLAKSFRPKPDPINHPSHYTSHPSGIESIEITKHMSFTLGNAVKYIWRADLKHDAIEDLKKAAWYIQCEIAKREGQAPSVPDQCTAQVPSKHQFVLPLYDGDYRIFFTDETSCKVVFKNNQWYDYESLAPITRKLTHWAPI